MIDTVILIIPNKNVKSLDNNQGCFPIWTMQSNGNGYKKWIKNMPKRKESNTPYYPRLTRCDNNVVSRIKIEFSVSKLLYGNNLNEVEEKDFPLIVGTLQKRLIEMGEIVEKTDIENASISTIHPSKNILISDGYTAYSVIKELGKINVHKKLELTKVNFKDDGKALHLYATNHSIVFYDKIADLSQNKKKAVDQDQTWQQFYLSDEIKNKQSPLEILRMEIRLCNKRKINSVMQKLGFHKNPTFKDIFKKDVCQKILKWYWDTIVTGENLFLFELENNPKQLLKDILRKEPEIKGKEAIYLVGLSVLCKDGGIRELRNILEKHMTQRSWYRMTDRVKLLNDIVNKKVFCSWVGQIEMVINNFEPFRIELESRLP